MISFCLITQTLWPNKGIDGAWMWLQVEFLACLILTILGYVPGIIYALYVIVFQNQEEYFDEARRPLYYSAWSESVCSLKTVQSLYPTNKLICNVFKEILKLCVYGSTVPFVIICKIEGEIIHLLLATVFGLLALQNVYASKLLYSHKLCWCKGPTYYDR